MSSEWTIDGAGAAAGHEPRATGTGSRGEGSGLRRRAARAARALAIGVFALRAAAEATIPGAGPMAPGAEATAVCRSERHGIRALDARAERLFARLCARSATVRTLVAELGAHRGVEVEVALVSSRDRGLATTGLRGQTRWTERGPSVVRIGGRTTHTGRISILVVLGAGQEEVLGHELQHALELASWGDIRRVPGWRSSGRLRHLAETDAAQAVERAVRAELRAATATPG